MTKIWEYDEGDDPGDVKHNTLEQWKGILRAQMKFQSNSVQGKIVSDWEFADEKLRLENALLHRELKAALMRIEALLSDSSDGDNKKVTSRFPLHVKRDGRKNRREINYMAVTDGNFRNKWIS
jgi:hypothetical protein